MLEAAISSIPSERPPALSIALRSGALLLKKKHRAFLVLARNGTTYKLNAGTPKATVRTDLGRIELLYDFMEFRVGDVGGEVWINNLRPQRGMRLPDCCVITLGDPHQRRRAFITFDVSHPEVIL